MNCVLTFDIGLEVKVGIENIIKAATQDQKSTIKLTIRISTTITILKYQFYERRKT